MNIYMKRTSRIAKFVKWSHLHILVSLDELMRTQPDGSQAPKPSETMKYKYICKEYISTYYIFIYTYISHYQGNRPGADITYASHLSMVYITSTYIYSASYIFTYIRIYIVTCTVYIHTYHFLREWYIRT